MLGIISWLDKRGRLDCMLLALVMIAGVVSPALADETPGKNYGTVSAGKATVNEYSRINSTQTLTATVSLTDIDACNQPGVHCQDFVSGTAVTATAICHPDDPANAAHGGWAVSAVSGQCLQSIKVCYGTTPPYTCTTITGQAATAANIGFKPFTLCTNPDPAKNFCVFNYSGAAGITGATGDDMFRVDDGAQAYLEYLNVGAIGDPYRLKYITRSGGNPDHGLVMPSGPASTFSDYKRFIDHHPSFIAQENGCYPVHIDLCSPAFTLPALAGACGSANGQHFTAAPTANLCTIGTASAVTGNGPWVWSCAGYMGGASATCAAKPSPVAGMCGASSNGKLFASAPATGLCDKGKASAVTGSGPWNWACAGTNGGADASCSAYKGVMRQVSVYYAEKGGIVSYVGDFYLGGYYQLQRSDLQAYQFLVVTNFTGSQCSAGGAWCTYASYGSGKNYVLTSNVSVLKAALPKLIGCANGAALVYTGPPARTDICDMSTVKLSIGMGEQ